MAVDAMAEVTGLFGPNAGLGRFVRSPRGLAVGGGLSVLGGLLAAVPELTNPDPMRSGLQNTAAAAGTGLGTTGGAIAGGLAGSMLFPGIGTLVGSALGGALGGASGKGLAELVTGLIEPSAEEKALNLARRQGQLALDLEEERLRTLLPYNTAAAKVAQDLQIERERQSALSQALGAALQVQSQGAAAQQLAATQALFGGLG